MSRDPDKQQLELLALFHYIYGGLVILFSCFPFIHLFMGLAMLFAGPAAADSGEDAAALSIIGMIFIAVPLLIIGTGWLLGAFIIFSGRRLQKLEGRTFCTVIAGIECALMPIGTVLGVFTLMALTKDSVKALFNPEDYPSPPIPIGTILKDNE